VFTASFSCVKWFFLKKNLFSAAPLRRAREALFSASFLRVKWFFLKKNLSLRSRPGGRWRRASREARSPCQPGFFSHFAEEKIETFKTAKNRRVKPRGFPLCSFPTIRLERGT
jgi:hypothetical protein